MIHSLQSLMHTILKQQKAPAWHIKLFEQWPTIVGNLQQVMRLEKIAGSMLIIGVYDASWMHELHMLSPVLIQTINQHLATPHVHRVRFKQVMRSKAMPKPIIASAPLQQVALPQLTYAQEAALNKIGDEQLRSYLHTFLGRCNNTRVSKK